jgi:hypothetical protein
MVSLETKRLLAELFVTVVDGERAVELLRQDLAKRYSFSAQVLYKTIDKDQAGITPDQLFGFVSHLAHGLTP